MRRYLPRFGCVHVCTTDCTLPDERNYEGVAFIVGWLGCTFELQFARRSS